MEALKRWFELKKAAGEFSSQREAAELFGWSQTTLSSYLTGHRTPTRSRAAHIEDVTDGMVSRHVWG